MPIEHKLIPSTEVHEPKGAFTAPAGAVYIANGAGSGNWTTPVFKPEGIVTAESGAVYVADGAGSGDWVVDLSKLKAVEIAYNENMSTQTPTAINTTTVIKYTSDVITPEVEILQNGQLKFKKAGVFVINTMFRIGRTTTSGATLTLFRVLKNGVVIDNKFSAMLKDNEVVLVMGYDSVIEVEIDDIFTTEYIRHPDFVNDGSLVPVLVAPTGWTPVPSSSVRVKELKYE